MKKLIAPIIALPGVAFADAAGHSLGTAQAIAGWMLSICLFLAGLLVVATAVKAVLYPETWKSTLIMAGLVGVGAGSAALLHSLGGAPISEISVLALCLAFGVYELVPNVIVLVGDLCGQKPS
jgi:hypothetical protein